MRGFGRVVVGAALTAALLVVAVAARGPREPGTNRDARVLTATADRGDIEVTVEAIGELDAVRSTVVASTLRTEAAILELVPDGTRVAAGDVLVRLDPAPFEERVATLDADVRELEARVALHARAVDWERNQAQAEIEAARFEVRAAELDRRQLADGDGPLELGAKEQKAAAAAEEHARLAAYLKDLEALSERGYPHPNEIAQARRRVDETAERLATAREQRDRYRDHVLPAAEEKADARIARARLEAGRKDKASAFQVAKASAARDQARAELATARAELATARRELEATVLRAPIPGMAILKKGYHGGAQRKPRAGDSVLHGQALVYLPDVAAMRATIRIRETDLHRLAPGQPATVRVDAFPELTLAAEVASIGALAESPAGQADAGKYFQVEVVLADGDPRLRPGMTARVAIHCAAARDVVNVPLQVVFGPPGGRFVWVDRGAVFERRAVTVGLESEERSEIVAGLAAGEHVALSEPPRAERLESGGGST